MKKAVKLLLVAIVLVLSVCGVVACSAPSDPKLDFTTIAFESVSIDYDGEEHTIVATGIPEGATATYSNQGPYVNAGEYDISLTVKMDGYNDYTKTVKLTIKKLNFVGIELSGVEVDYDGNEHSATATGIPSFATVNYEGVGPFVDAGEYTTKLTVSYPNYNDFVATATVKINKIDFVGITFADKSFEYDGNFHEITVAGTLPATASVKYSCDVDGVTNSAKEIGSYPITATITDKNHNDLILEATLNITGSDEERFMAFTKNGTLFFQNAMDDNELYFYDASTENLSRVSGEMIYDIVSYGDNGVVYVSSTLFMTAIRKATFVNETVSTETLYTEFGLRYVQVNGNEVYYVINGLTNEQSGIYKVDTSESEPVSVCLSKGKAYYLQLVDNVLYFADGANGKKLSKINTTTQNQSRSLVVDEKINNLVYDNGSLYYTVNNLLGDYIEKFVISSSTRRKLTIDAGASLTVVGNRLYYVNVDKFTTRLIGNGIYSVSTSPLGDYNLTGTLVIEGGDLGVCSLAENDGNLYYYDVDGYKLMEYNLSSQTAVNLLDGFVKPEDPTPISTGSKLQEYGGNIYYLDIWEGKTLRCYNPTTKLNYAITSNKVADFNIIGDVLYVNMVSFLVNNDMYRANLKTGSALEKISTYSAYEFVSDGEFVYYIEENAVGAKTAIHKCKLDGTEDVIIYEKGVTNLKLVNGTLYFIDGSNIHVFNISTSTDTTVKVDSKEIHTDTFDTDGTYLYYRDMSGLFWKNTCLARCKLDGTEKVVMVENVDPINIVYYDGQVYYYTDTTKYTNGLFSVSASVTETTTGTEILAESSGLYAKNFVVVGDKVYFVDYKSQLLGNAHLYELTIGGEPQLIK